MDGALRRLFVEGSLAGMDDAELLERFAERRDGAAFEGLVRRHGPAVWAACRAVLRDDHDAEDAFQATFIILARRSPALWTAGGSLGCWLHKVAHRVSARLIADASRRRARERRAATSAVATQDTSADDLRAAVHREVARLPERFRRPVVLCDLEGLTHAQAAAELSQGEATVRRRLAEARALLRSRLERRGLAPSVGLLGLLRVGRAEAALPESLAIASARAACGVSSGHAAVIALGGAVLRGVQLIRAMRAAAIALVLATAGVAIVAGVAARPLGPGEHSAAPPAPLQSPTTPTAAPQVAAEDDPGDLVPIAGRILDPEGRPVAGSRVHYFVERPRATYWPPVDGMTTSGVTTGPDGRFILQVEAPGFEEMIRGESGDRPTVAAFADGFGPSWRVLGSAAEADDLTLRLVTDDVPVEGRVLDLEGRPIAGVRVIPRSISAAAGGDLSAYVDHLETVRDNHDNAWAGLDGSLPLHAIEAEDLGATTDLDGRFRLDGIGRERVVDLDFRGPTIAAGFGGFLFARTRPGPTYRFPMDRGEAEYGTFVIHGASFDHVAMPTRPVDGFVRDAESGAPIPGLAIVSERFAGNLVWGRRDVRATTDTEGRYRLLGMPPGEGNVIVAVPGPGQPYLGLDRTVPGSLSSDPARVDFELTRGVTIRGRVTDATSGTPIVARVEYFAFTDNPHLEGLRDFDVDPVITGVDGSFELVGLPGRGLIAARDERDGYAVARGADEIEGMEDLSGVAESFSTKPYICEAQNFHTLAAIDPPADAEAIRRDLQLEPGLAVSGAVVGPDGEAIDGEVEVTGLRAWTMVWDNGYSRLDSSEFTVEALDPDRPRRLTFRHAGRDLIASLIVRGDEPGPLTVRLEAAAVVTGRLVDGRGRPKSHVDINVGKLDFDGPVRSWVGRFAEVTVEDDGAFRVSGLVPGLPYELNVREGNRLTGRIADGLVLEPGASRDLGEIVVGEDE